MKLLRFDDHGITRLGVLDHDRITPLDALAADYPTMLSIIAGGEAALHKVRVIADAAENTVALGDARLLAPIERPGKYLAIGMNYRKHVEEAGRLGITPPANQFWFNKQTSCLAGPFDDIDPGVTEKLDYEAELGVVIGKAAKGVSEAEASDHVFGYVVANDVSARDWQQHSPTFTMGKSFDTHGPIGPWIVTADEIPDPHALKIRCLVNGEIRQDSDTSELIYNIWQQIAYLSTAFTLEPGDLLATGTPSGVGIGMQPRASCNRATLSAVRSKESGQSRTACAAQDAETKAEYPAHQAASAAAMFDVEHMKRGYPPHPGGVARKAYRAQRSSMRSPLDTEA